MKFRNLILPLALLLLTTSCLPGPPSEPVDPPGPPADFSSEELSVLVEQVTLFENYCSGNDFGGQPDNDPYLASLLAYGWLASRDLRQPYAGQTDDDVRLPEDLVRFFAELSSDSGDFPKSISLYADTSRAIQPEILDAHREGDLAVLQIGRSLIPAGQTRPYELFPATYVFRAVPLGEDIPAPLAGEFRSGDAVWRLVSVVNHTQTAPLDAAAVSLSTPQDLLALAEQINSGDRDAQNKVYLLQNDIDMTGVAFTPIGRNQQVLGWWDPRDSSLPGFNALFDGQGHAIRNLEVTLTEGVPEQPAHAGLFATIGPRGRVRNLRLEDASVTSTVWWNAEGDNPSSIATGLLAGQSFGRIESCFAGGTVAGTYQVGGLVGSAEGPDEFERSDIRNCVVEATVTGNSETGGFVGALHFTDVRRCAVIGRVTAVAAPDRSLPRAVGGFAGFLVAADLSDSVASVDIRTNAVSEWVGAFLAYNQGNVSGCAYSLDKAPLWEAIDVFYDATGARYNEAVGLTQAEIDARVSAILKEASI